ncbi:hypothetical protein O185_25400 [Photorhabdus temperata J3]|uniref:Uncharacterized protein n=1 Tax=Photorhabdus temperata J3 TaxID=1389415 RepID=U7QQV7_PHOTE|nr:hypothetical protein O185_25400 [Photorhabdus temperata J3]
MVILPNEPQIECFEAPVGGHMEQEQNGHYFAEIHTSLTVALTMPVFETKLRSLRNKSPTKIINIAEKFN